MSLPNPAGSGGMPPPPPYPGTGVPPPPYPGAGAGACPTYGENFTVPPFQEPYDAFREWAQANPQPPPPPAPPVPPNPINDCFNVCNMRAKLQNEECKTKVKQFTEFMKQNGCPGTWCKTGGARKCYPRKKAPAKKKKKCQNKPRAKKCC